MSFLRSTLERRRDQNACLLEDQKGFPSAHAGSPRLPLLLAMVCRLRPLCLWGQSGVPKWCKTETLYFNFCLLRAQFPAERPERRGQTRTSNFKSEKKSAGLTVRRERVCVSVRCRSRELTGVRSGKLIGYLEG
jgi:hypothetical protein